MQIRKVNAGMKPLSQTIQIKHLFGDDGEICQHCSRLDVGFVLQTHLQNGLRALLRGLLEALQRSSLEEAHAFPFPRSALLGMPFVVCLMRNVVSLSLTAGHVWDLIPLTLAKGTVGSPKLGPQRHECLSSLLLPAL